MYVGVGMTKVESREISEGSSNNLGQMWWAVEVMRSGWILDVGQVGLVGLREGCDDVESKKERSQGEQQGFWPEQVE